MALAIRATLQRTKRDSSRAGIGAARDASGSFRGILGIRLVPAGHYLLGANALSWPPCLHGLEIEVALQED